MEIAKCETWQKYKKMPSFLFSCMMGKRVVFQMLQFLGPEFIPNCRKCLQGKKNVIFG